MRTMTALISRNRKLFFRDRGMFLSSLITPVILIVLYATFLANVYKTVDKEKAKAFFEEREKTKLIPPKVNMKTDRMLRTFIITGGIEI